MNKEERRMSNEGVTTYQLLIHLSPFTTIPSPPNLGSILARYMDTYYQDNAFIQLASLQTN